MQNSTIRAIVKEMIIVSPASITGESVTHYFRVRMISNSLAYMTYRHLAHTSLYPTHINY